VVILEELLLELLIEELELELELDEELLELELDEELLILSADELLELLIEELLDEEEVSGARAINTPAFSSKLSLQRAVLSPVEPVDNFTNHACSTQATPPVSKTSLKSVGGVKVYEVPESN